MLQEGGVLLKHSLVRKCCQGEHIDLLRYFREHHRSVFHPQILLDHVELPDGRLVSFLVDECGAQITWRTVDSLFKGSAIDCDLLNYLDAKGCHEWLSSVCSPFLSRVCQHPRNYETALLESLLQRGADPNYRKNRHRYDSVSVTPLSCILAVLVMLPMLSLDL